MKRISELLVDNLGVFMRIIILFVIILFIFSHTNPQVNTDIKSNNFKNLSESFNILSKENSIFIVPENTPCLNFIVNYHLDGIQYKKYFPNDVPDSILEQKNIIAIGLPNENSFIKKCLEQIPAELNSNSIIIGDNKFAGNDFGIIFTIANENQHGGSP